MVKMGKNYYGTYYCTPPFHHDPDLPAHSMQTFYLVASPQAKVPRPSVYPSWSSTQRVTEGIPCGGPSTLSPTMPASLHGTRAVTLAHLKAVQVLHYTIHGSGVVHRALNTALAEYTNLYSSMGDATLFIMTDACPCCCCWNSNRNTNALPPYLPPFVHMTEGHCASERTSAQNPTAAGHSISQGKDLAAAERAATQVEGMGPTPNHHATFYSRASLSLHLSTILCLLTILGQEMWRNRMHGCGDTSRTMAQSTESSPTTTTISTKPAISQGSSLMSQSIAMQMAHYKAHAAAKDDAPESNSGSQHSASVKSMAASLSRPHCKSDVAGSATSPSKLQDDLEGEGACTPNEKLGLLLHVPWEHPHQTGCMALSASVQPDRTALETASPMPEEKRVHQMEKHLHLPPNLLQLQLSMLTHSPPRSSPVVLALLPPPLVKKCVYSRICHNA
ncbi:hypothetical protein B0H17DRAFT_1148143 [Mycena rosella]|uniref:Uncharacterized protein n=1 Tax=Mycena rosella TaxID=1033263 RepID=A0AAD7CDT0_MYCRO|nr:hypothetical protein B0H17DRAFT_1148143 [Mycena rosella]